MGDGADRGVPAHTYDLPPQLRLRPRRRGASDLRQTSPLLARHACRRPRDAEDPAHLGRRRRRLLRRRGRFDLPAAEGRMFEIGGLDVVTWNEPLLAHRLGAGQAPRKIHLPFGLMRANAGVIEAPNVPDAHHSGSGECSKPATTWSRTTTRCKRSSLPLVAARRVSPARRVNIVALGSSTDDARMRRSRGSGAKDAPRICYVNTAVATARTASSPSTSSLMVSATRASPLLPWPPPDPRALVLEQDVLIVSGGNTANMLAIWRVHGFEMTVLGGLQEGTACWLERGDAVLVRGRGHRLVRRVSTGCAATKLASSPSSACPHYDLEEATPADVPPARGRGLSRGVAA